jgi:hypothetical protein
MPTTMFERPMFIVSAPRSGSTLLFELLARSPDVWTIGGENHAILEGIAPLHPANRRWESNRLLRADATPEIASRLRQGFAGGRATGVGGRFIEKTPKNSLRIPFLDAVFPDALFVHLVRDALPTMSSMLDAWRSQRFTTYPELPGWSGPAWTMLLFPGWRDGIGQPLARTVVEQWRAAHRHIVEDLRAIPSQRQYALRYEDLLENPKATLARLVNFAGLAWDDSSANKLPLSRATLTPPTPDKWRINEPELRPYLGPV